MTAPTEKTLPLGTSDFAALRNSNEIYIDKTALIYELASVRSKIFISRPRRFGKSLLVSTFESLFKNGLRDFSGLKIEKLWKDKTYPVVRLDFSDLKDLPSAEEFQKSLRSMIATAFAAIGFRYDPADTVSLFLDQFKLWLSTLETNSFVLLIDEYDAPLTAHLENSRLFNEIRTVLSRFYAVVKRYEGCLRFFFMTGITKYSQTSIFSELNNFDDITLNPAYATLLGYTEEEIKSGFAAYLRNAAEKLGTTEKHVLQNLRDNYDGFSFEPSAQSHVFCPWSVLNFFKYPQQGFKNYWYESGGQPSLLLKYLEKHQLVQPESFGVPVAMTLDELGAVRQYDKLSVEALLFQAGYLTIREQLNVAEVEVGYPNKEVELSMARLYADEMLRDINRLDAGVSRLAKMLDRECPETVIAHFNQVFNAIDYSRYPVVNEASCRSHLQVLLMGGAMVPDVEKHSALGRSDLEVETPHRRWVFELKFSADGTNAEKLLRSAVMQIRDRRYGEAPHGRELIAVAMVFNGSERRFDRWEVVPGAAS